MLVGDVLELLLLSLPSLLYRRFRRRRGATARQASASVGLVRGEARHYGAAVGVLLVTAVLGYLALRMIPEQEVRQRGTTLGAADGAAAYVGIVILALAEEMLFRGWLGGVLVRRLGFAAGNAVQSVVFLLPHLLLLLVSAALWPVLPVQLAAGWLLGWLRARSGSIGPGWLAHAGANVVAAALL